MDRLFVMFGRTHIINHRPMSNICRTIKCMNRSPVVSKSCLTCSIYSHKVQMTSNMLLRAPHSLLYNSFYTDNITGPVVLHITKFDLNGNYEIDVVKKSQLLMSHKLQPRDIRFTAPSLLYVRQSSIIMRLLHIKAIINPKNVILLESDHPTIVSFIPELKEKLSNNLDMLPFELRVVEALLTKMFAELEDNLNELQPSIVNVLDNLLDPQFHTIDRAQLHILLYQSNRLSEFNSLVKDIQVTLSDMLEYEEDLASMYLTHNSLSDEERSVDDIEEVENILEAFLMQTEDMLSRVQRLRDLIDQSENIILINLDSLRNIMLRLSLQLEMGTFSATIGGLFGLAFGMNLNSSLEDNVYAFWIVTGLMVTSAGLLWRHLLAFIGKNLTHSENKKIFKLKSK